MRQEGEARCAYSAAVWVNKKHATQQVAIPSSDVVAGDTEVTDEREKADLLLTTFFPVPPKPVDRDSTSVKLRLVTRNGSRPCEYAGKKVPLRIKLPMLTLGEVEAAIMQSRSDKAPGLDEITFRVWKELWPVLGGVVLRLYQASLDLEYVPQRSRQMHRKKRTTGTAVFSNSRS
jgi:hypothetical protein